MDTPARRDFGLLFASFGLSSVGDYLALTTLTLKVQELTHSGWAVSGLLLAGLLPLVVFGPIGGAIVDRYETRKVLGMTSLLQGAVAAALAFADSLPLILLLSLLLGTGVAVSQPALMVLVPRVAGEEHVTRANALLEIARWAGTPLGALLGGTLTAALGPRTTLLADAATFALIAVAVAAMRTRRAAAPSADDRDAGRARRGMQFLWRDHLLRLSVLVLGGVVVFAAIDNVAEVFFAKGVLRAGRIGYGLLVASWTLGIALGAVATGRRARERSLAPAVLLGAFIGGGAIFLAGAFPLLPFALAMFLVGGFANGIELVAMRSLIHHRVPEELRGRVFGAYYAIVNGAQIAALAAGGALLEAIGARGALLVAGGGAIAIGVLGSLAYARLPDTAADQSLTSPRTPPA